MNDGQQQVEHLPEQNRRQDDCKINFDDETRIIRISLVSLPFCTEDHLRLIYKYFKQFGVIHSILFGEMNEDACGLIKFKEAAAVVRFKNIRHFYLDYYEIEIESVGVKHSQSHNFVNNIGETNEEDTLLQPAEQESPKNILNALNDDCLHHVFKKLPYSSFSFVANVCTRFNQIAKEAFKSRSKCKYNYKVIDMFDFPTLLQVNNFLINFGSFIATISVELPHRNSENLTNFANSILKMIDTHSTNLIELNLSGFEVDEQTLIGINSLLSRLKILHIGSESLIASTIDLLSACSQLEALNISGNQVNVDIILPNITFPKLVKLRLISILGVFRRWTRVRLLNTFLMRNPNLEILEIERCALIGCDINILMVQNILKLQTLRITQNEFYAVKDRPILHLNQLKYLKVLKFDSFYFRNDITSIMQLLSSNEISINELELTGISFDDFAFNNIKIESITKLNILDSDEFDDMFLVRLARSLPNLKSLKIVSQFEFTASMIENMLPYANQLATLHIGLEDNRHSLFHQYYDYNSILKTIKRRITKIKLNIQISCRFEDPVVRKLRKFAVLSIDPDWLVIENVYENFLPEVYHFSLQS